MKKKRINLPLSYEVQANFDSERYLKVRIKVMHSGLNLNNTYFGLDAIERAKPSLSNIPILAFIKKEDGTSNEDFGGHEFEIKITEDEMKYVYLGRPIGLIPETNNYELETDEDGKTFVIVDGYVWKQYANSALDILTRDQVKKVSMETLVSDFNWEETHIDILDYAYIGVAMLGEGVREAMLGAKAEIINYSQSTISEMLIELKETLKGGQQNMEVETVETVQETVEIPVEETVEIPVEETVEETVEATEETVEATEETVEEETVETVEEAEETVEEVEDITNFAAEIEALKAEITSLKEENARLQTFVDATQEKAKTDALDALFAKFSDLTGVEAAQALRAKSLEMKLSDIETQLYAIRGRNVDVALKSEEDSEGPAWKKLVFQYNHSANTGGPEWADLVDQYKKEGE